MMRVLILGANGQLGRALQACTPEDVQIRAHSRAELNIADSRAVTAAVQDFKPQVILNAAAYTQVDRAEAEQGAAYAINGDGPAHLAEAAKGIDSRVIHVSTDFVFDGGKATPYLPDDAPNPLGVYGASKLAGERRLRQALPERSIVIRTAWVYAAEGKNFVKTMLRLMAERETLGVVADQIGSPTWAHSLAQAVWAAALSSECHGIFHWTDAGVASWYDFAVAIREEGEALGLLSAKAALIHPIRTADYPTPAVRPAYSVLDKTAAQQALNLPARHWRSNLRKMLAELRETHTTS